MKDYFRKLRGWGSSRVFRRYAAFQAPGLLLVAAGLFALRVVVDLPLWVPLAGTFVWVVKDLAMFPVLKSAYGDDSEGPTVSGLKGVVVDTLAPSGLVRVQGELWRATSAQRDLAIGRGAVVQVKDRRGLTLVVTPWTAEPGHSEPQTEMEDEG
jgi:membrane protein implicated in regulation of membrane protease activity